MGGGVPFCPGAGVARRGSGGLRHLELKLAAVEVPSGAAGRSLPACAGSREALGSESAPS